MDVWEDGHGTALSCKWRVIQKVEIGAELKTFMRGKTYQLIFHFTTCSVLETDFNPVMNGAKPNIWFIGVVCHTIEIWLWSIAGCVMKEYVCSIHC